MKLTSLTPIAPTADNTLVPGVGTAIAERSVLVPPEKPDWQPTTKLGVWLLRVWDMDTAGCKFGASLRLVYKFHHPSLSALPQFSSAADRTYYTKVDLSEYLPGQALEVRNAIDWKKRETRFYDGEPAEELIFHTTKDGPLDDGIVTAEVVIEGTFRHTFDLHAFPFDVQHLPVVLRHWRKSKADYAREWQLIDTSTYAHDESMLKFSDWDLDLHGLSSQLTHGPPVDLSFLIPMQRKPWWYTITVSFTLLIILGFALTGMFTDPTDVHSRLGLASSLVLAAVAVKFVVAADLPRVPYLTALDVEYALVLFYLLCISYAFLICDTVESNDAAKWYAVAGALLDLGFVCIFPLKYIYRRRAGKAAARLSSRSAGGY